VSINVAEKFRLFTKQHNSHWHIRYGEIEPFFRDGYACVTHGQYLAASLCFITGIEMSLRLPLLHNLKLDIRDAWKSKEIGVPLLSNKLLREAKAIGLPVEVLRFDHDPEDSEFLLKLQSDDRLKQAHIVRLRNNICHGNLNIFTKEEDGEGKIYRSDIEKEAKQLEKVAITWGEGYGRWHSGLEPETVGPEDAPTKVG